MAAIIGLKQVSDSNYTVVALPSSGLWTPGQPLPADIDHTAISPRPLLDALASYDSLRALAARDLPGTASTAPHISNGGDSNSKGEWGQAAEGRIYQWTAVNRFGVVERGEERSLADVREIRGLYQWQAFTVSSPPPVSQLLEYQEFMGVREAQKAAAV